MASPTGKGTRSPPPPPLIGRAGNLTIFITPPPRPPRPPPTTSISNSNPSPVQAPPIRWEGHRAAPRISVESVYEFLWSALAKAQDVHSSLDSYVADLFGLNHSKYQRELNDYYERMQKVASVPAASHRQYQIFQFGFMPMKNEFSDATQPKDNTSKIEAL